MSTSSVSSTTGVTSTLGERGLAPRLVVERRDPHQPVHAVLAGQRAVGERRLHHERRRLDAGLLGVGRVEDLGRVVVALGPAQVHPHQHLGPVGGVGAAGAGVDRDRARRARRTRRRAACGSRVPRCPPAAPAATPPPPRAGRGPRARSPPTGRRGGACSASSRPRSARSDAIRRVTRWARSWSFHSSGSAASPSRSASWARIVAGRAPPRSRRASRRALAAPRRGRCWTRSEVTGGGRDREPARARLHPGLGGQPAGLHRLHQRLVVALVLVGVAAAKSARRDRTLARPR